MTPTQQIIEDFADALDQLLAEMQLNTRDQVHITKAIVAVFDPWDWHGEESVATALMRNLPIKERMP